MLAAPPGIQIREASPADDGSIVGLLGQTLGWVDDDRHRALFDWKHRSSPFGPSPGWLAFDDDGLVGARLFMRWMFRHADDPVTAVRAVDTATHPRARGRGIFRCLTLRGVDELTAAGVGWVFNTPNTQSAPGYLSMGWQQLGHLPIAVRPTIRGASRLTSARRPAELWSLDTSAGEEVCSVLGDDGEVTALLEDAGSSTDQVQTVRSAEYLRWRYASGPVHYRAVVQGSTIREGIVIFRIRRRGRAREAVIAEVLVPGRDLRTASRLCRRAIDAGRADYAVASGSVRPRAWLPAPGAGPLLTWRALARTARPPLPGWDLCIGDVELF